MTLNLRRSTHSLESDPDPTVLNELRRAFYITQKRDDSYGYSHIAGYHGVPGWYCWHHQTLQRITGTGPFFLPWHRAYLSCLELQLQQNAKNATITIPYWDWSSQESRSGNQGLPKLYSDETANGQPNPLFKFHVRIPSAGLDSDTARDPDKIEILPSPKDIDKIIYDDNDFDDFLLDLEEVHDTIHGWVNKNPATNEVSMANVALAAYDPIFFAHHCMIDRIWYCWQLQHGPTKGFEHMLEVPLPPFQLNVSDTIDIRRLGYMYAGDARSIYVSGARGA